MKLPAATIKLSTISRPNEETRHGFQLQEQTINTGWCQRTYAERRK